MRGSDAGPTTASTTTTAALASSGAGADVSHSSVTLFAAERLQAAVKSDDEIAAIKATYKSRRTGRAVAGFYHNQNELIEELLKPVGADQDLEDETAGLLKLKIAMYGSLVANVCLFALQLFAAITSGSLSLFATMADSFMDLASNLVLVVASISAAKRNVQRFPAGKQRFETAGIVVFSCIMGALAVQLIIEGATALASGNHETELGPVNLSCIGIAVGVKACLWAYCSALSKYPSAKILAQDHRNDVTLNLTGIVLSIMGQKLKWWIDPVGGILIALYILVNWGETAMEHIQMFIGKTASPIFLSRVTYLAMNHDPEVLQVDTVRAYSSGAGYFVEVDIVMDAMTPLQKSHDIGEALQVKIESLEGVERAFVHIDYESTHTPEHPS
ncbi:cation efflux family-domain-containing protein [Chytriomyces sp. MP71]|nr:cation efflux family-domain-containing protein [Chytriomyces sp. MP71]